MNKRARARELLLLTLLLGGCRSSRDHGAPADHVQASLGGRIAARVGDDAIPVELVAKVAAEQKISPEEALRRLIDDAVAANAARAKGTDQVTRTAWRLLAARARFAADKMLANARSAGPPTDEEIEALSREHWREIDRPAAVRTMHALVKVEGASGEATRQKARRVAEAVNLAVAKTPKDASLDEFKAAASAAVASAGGAADMLVVEALPPFTESGQITEGEGAMVPAFAKGAHAIGHVGDVSPLVETSFGFHSIRLLARIPEQRMPIESRRVALADAIYAVRAKKMVDAVLQEKTKRYRPEVLASAEQTMREIAAKSGASEGQ